MLTDFIEFKRYTIEDIFAEFGEISHENTLVIIRNIIENKKNNSHPKELDDYDLDHAYVSSESNNKLNRILFLRKDNVRRCAFMYLTRILPLNGLPSVSCVVETLRFTNVEDAPFDDVSFRSFRLLECKPNLMNSKFQVSEWGGNSNAQVKENYKNEIKNVDNRKCVDKIWDHLSKNSALLGSPGIYYYFNLSSICIHCGNKEELKASCKLGGNYWYHKYLPSDLSDFIDKL